jgi:SAM-dependent methyltransferase
MRANGPDDSTKTLESNARSRERDRFRYGDLTGIDISTTAIKRLTEKPKYEDGPFPKFRGFCGTIKDAGLSEGSQDIIFLSYFVDRDSDQRGTFEESVRILRSGGRIVLEGLFPCKLVDSKGVSYGTANVTKGQDAVEDIQLVIAEFKRLGATPVIVGVGQRLVYSIDGSEVLPSYILVFKKI